MDIILFVGIEIDKTSFTYKENLSDVNFEQIWLQVKLSNTKPFLLSSIYKPPNLSKCSYFEKLSNNIETALSFGLPVLILGDLNTNCSAEVFNSSNEIYKLCELLSLRQLINDYTRVTTETKTVIDIILSNFEEHKHTCVTPVTLSDHYLISTIIGTSKHPETRTIRCRSFKKFDINTFLTDLNSRLLGLSNDISSIQDAWDDFKHLFTDICDKHAPMRIQN